MVSAAGQPAEPSLDSGEIRPLAVPSIAHLGLDERIQFLLERMVDSARADAGVVMLGADSTGLLVPRSWVGWDAKALQAARCQVGDGFVGIVAKDGEPAVVHNLREDAPLLKRPASGHGIGVVVGLPLKSGGQTLGVVRIDFLQPRSLDQADVHRLAAVADHIAALAETERLYEESQKRNAELERKNAELLELDRLKGDFLSMVSHELRTPLTAIIGYTDLLLREVHGPLNPRQQQHELAVKKAAHRLLALINDLLDVTRLEGGHVELVPAQIRLAATFDAAIGDVQAAAAGREIDLRLDVPARLPMVRADAERLRQVIVNLLDNAIKFTPHGGTVTLRAERRDGAARVCVSDTGIGVPAEQLERIWDRFYQADSSTRRRFGGTGLGLAIVRNLVHLHGGTVEAASPGPGHGSTFCFTLPVAPAEADAESSLPLSPTAPPPAAGGGRLILIVDDEPDNREVIASIVRDLLGHRSLLARDGEEGIALARQQPDLILLDLRMPGLSGFDVAQRLKADPATTAIPIVAITALSDRGDRDAALQAGCVGWVTKPFTQPGLVDAIQRALGSAAGARA